MKVCVLTGIDATEYLKGFASFDIELTVITPSSKEENLFPGISGINELACQCNFEEVSYHGLDLHDKISSLQPEILISIGWRRILKSEVIDLAGLAINIHPAILPEYKGYHTEPYVIMNAEKKHGITAHKLTPGLDEGDIYHQSEFDISRFSTVSLLKKCVSDLSKEFCEELMKGLLESSLLPYPQDHSKTKVIAGKRKPDDSKIDPSKSLNELFDEIRACDPERYPAYFEFEGRLVGVKLFTIDDKRNNELEI